MARKLQLIAAEGEKAKTHDWECTFWLGCTHFCVYCPSRVKGEKQNNFVLLLDFSKLEDLEVRDCIVQVNPDGDPFCRMQRSKENPNVIQEGTDIPVEWTREMFKWIERQHPSITWLFWTKNPAGYLGWLRELTALKDRVILATSIETNKSMSTYSQAVKPQVRAWCMHHLSIKLGFKTIVGLDPLYRFDVVMLTSWLVRIRPSLVVIGLDSWGHIYKARMPHPILEDYLEMKMNLEDAGIRLFERENIKRWLKPNLQN